MALTEMDVVKITDYADDQAPSIKKYKHHTPEGYGFIIYNN